MVFNNSLLKLAWIIRCSFVSATAALPMEQLCCLQRRRGRFFANSPPPHTHTHCGCTICLHTALWSMESSNQRQVSFLPLVQLQLYCMRSNTLPSSLDYFTGFLQGISQSSLGQEWVWPGTNHLSHNANRVGHSTGIPNGCSTVEP